MTTKKKEMEAPAPDRAAVNYTAICICLCCVAKTQYRKKCTRILVQFESPREACGGGGRQFFFLFKPMNAPRQPVRGEKCKKFTCVKMGRKKKGGVIEDLCLCQRVTCMWSFAPKDLLQFGHFRDRDVRRSSTHSLQNTWPHVLIAVFLKLTRQTVQMAKVYTKPASAGDQIK